MDQREKLEEELRQVLDSSAQRAGYLGPLRRERVHRIRRLRALYMLLTAGFVVVAIIGVALAMNLASNRRAVPPVQVSELFGPQLLYVVDRAPNGRPSDAEVLAVQANSTGSQIVARYPLGSDPDVVLSPDGSRLYGVSFVWLSDTETQSMLRVFDTTTAGLITEVPIPDWQGTTGFHIINKTAISPDGAYVYVLVGFASDAPGRPQSLATFDVSAGSLLPDVASLDGCGWGPTILPTSSLGVVVVCREIGEVWFLQVSNSGAVESKERLSLAIPSATVTDAQGNTQNIGFVSQAVLSPDRTTLYAITRQGLVLVIDVATRSIASQVQLQLPGRLLVAVPQVQISQSGDTLFLGLGAGPDAIHADSILGVDTATWKSRGPAGTPRFSAFVVSNDGRRIFTIDFEAQRLSQIGVESMTALGPIGVVADRPDAVYLAP